jgi:hypothetical protein
MKFLGFWDIVPTGKMTKQIYVLSQIKRYNEEYIEGINRLEKLPLRGLNKNPI